MTKYGLLAGIKNYFKNRLPLDKKLVPPEKTYVPPTFLLDIKPVSTSKCKISTCKKENTK